MILVAFFLIFARFSCRNNRFFARRLRWNRRRPERIGRARRRTTATMWSGTMTADNSLFTFWRKLSSKPLRDGLLKFAERRDAVASPLRSQRKYLELNGAVIGDIVRTVSDFLAVHGLPKEEKTLVATNRITFRKPISMGGTGEQSHTHQRFPHVWDKNWFFVLAGIWISNHLVERSRGNCFGFTWQTALPICRIRWITPESRIPTYPLQYIINHEKYGKQWLFLVDQLVFSQFFLPHNRPLSSRFSHLSLLFTDAFSFGARLFSVRFAFEKPTKLGDFKCKKRVFEMWQNGVWTDIQTSFRWVFTLGKSTIFCQFLR